MIVITLSDIIGISLIAILIVVGLIWITINCVVTIYKTKSKKWHNCFECKHYYLSDVAGYGNYCWYGCKENENINDEHSMNNGIEYRKCKEFEKE